MSKKSQVLNIRLPEELILELDNLVEKRIFKSRSEAIREFARQYVQEQQLYITAKNAKNSEQEGGRW
ncbi:MAG: ribbon-helix-helix domain-containing protein [Nanoarchaeota archaeon]|nr:ribbon-helix-helix domain-containing protein [Nanoarchaeota archaeon]MBU1321278.1 ribbon-helix-helix domain-containing protein [Nanoarchaeota archaeon]MBU1597108.1 ribbon-helix-helix domain-containing protein [Nanoarchaeota archaeon]MBU2442149.1 ribbon-helix-helix domain-containing protein [Nanoarchaeota archaeon]